MSSEIAQAPKEDIPLSSAIADNLDLPPNTHLEPPGSDTYGMLHSHLIRITSCDLLRLGYMRSQVC